MIMARGMITGVGLTKFGVLGLAMALSACASSDARYPSLALRPFETGAAQTATAPEITASIRPATSPAALSALREAASGAHAAFVERESATQRLARAAAGRSVETNARAAALVAMADLSAKRGATASVLADLDLLAVNAASALAADPALVALQTEVAAMVAREDAGIAQLWAVMGQ